MPVSAELQRKPRKIIHSLLIAAVYLVAFTGLDLITKQFQGLPGIVAWYPPVGITYALLLVFGVNFAPAVMIALLVSNIFIYRMPQPAYLLIIWALILSLMYASAAAFLRKRIRIDWQLRKMRDVTWLILTAVIFSALLAILSVLSSALSSNMPRSELIRSIYDWWIGETVGILTVTPFLLMFVMPGLKRFMEGSPLRQPGGRSFPRPSLASIGQVISIALTIYWVFGAPVLDEFHPLYLIALPLIWVALQRGLKGVSAALLLMNSGVVLALWLFRSNLSQLGGLELLMIVNCIVTLLMGAVVSERKHAEEDLTDSENRFRALIENSNDAIALINTEGKIIYRSPAAYKLMGLDPSKSQSDSMFGSVHPDDMKDAGNRFAQILEVPGTSIPFKYRVQYADKSWRWVEGTGINLLEEPGINAIVTNYRDITERNRTEVERQTLLEIMQGVAVTGSLKELLELIRQSLSKVIYAENFFVVFHNKNNGMFEEVFAVDQYDPPMAPSKLDKSIISYVFRSGEPLLLTQKKFDELVERGEAELVGTKPAIWMGAPLKTLTGLIGVMAVQNYEDPSCYSERDKEFLSSISTQVAAAIERKRVEESLYESEEKYRSLVDEVNDGFYITDEAGVFAFANPAMARMYGVDSPKALVGRKFSDFLSSDSPEGLGEAYGSSMQTGSTPEVIQGKILRPDGTHAFIEIKPAMIIKEGKIVGTRGVVRDVTERKQREEAIQSRTDELTSLYQLSRSLADANDLENVIELVNRQTVEIVKTTFACIALIEEGDLVPQAIYPVRNMEPNFIIGDRQPISALPFCQQVLDKNEPVVLQTNNPEVSSLERTTLMFDFAQMVCLVPLRAGDDLQRINQALGLLILGEVREEKREAFTPEKIRLARNIGYQAASAIRRLLLHKDAERRLQHLASLSEIDRLIASNFDLRINLQMILNHVIEQLGVDAADVLVFNTRIQALEFAAGRGFRSPRLEGIRIRSGEGQAGQAMIKRKIIQIKDVATSGASFAYPDLWKVENVVTYFAVPLITKGQVNGVLEICNRSPLDPSEEWLKFLNTLAGQAAIAIDNVQMFESLQRTTDELELAYDATIEGWSHALDLRDKETEGHTQRVTGMTVDLARSFGLSETELVQVRWGALLHDIGKMGVPDSILLKPGSLSENEWVLMKKHPGLAYEMLLPIRYLHGALDIPYCHHERWDGTGYPRGLKGEEIPIAARIFAVVDVWDALTSDRPYRPAWSEEKALKHIKTGAGTHFDPKVVIKFIAGHR